MAFSPFFEEKEEYNSYLEELEIVHIDGDYSNCDIKNLINKTIKILLKKLLEKKEKKRE
jgi:hypothetical protein